MSRTQGITPITDIEQANTNPGGNELDTHISNEKKIIHTIDQVVKSSIEISVTEKLTNIIKGYYNSRNGVYPLTEFYFYISGTYLEIYDRLGAHLIDIGIGSFTIDEIDWILNNLPQYNKGNIFADKSQVHLDFTELRNEGWMVWRRSGTFNSLIGYIRKYLSHVEKDPGDNEYYFEERQDTNIVSVFEREIIDDFIQNRNPVVHVTNISIDHDYIKLLMGHHEDITVMLYPANAADLTYYYQMTDNGIASFDSSINRVTGLNEGITDIMFISNDNPDIKATLNVEVIEYDRLYNNKYKIIRNDEDGYGIDESYIIGMDEGLTIEEFSHSFKNRDTNLHFYTKDDDEIAVTDYWQWLTTGMAVKLYANGSFYEQLRIVVRGDIDGNGAINEYDKQYIRNHVNGADILSGYKLIAADVDRNKVVNLDDLNMIDRYIKGEIRSLN